LCIRQLSVIGQIYQTIVDILAHGILGEFMIFPSRIDHGYQKMIVEELA
jgi:hypothetical protein